MGNSVKPLSVSNLPIATHEGHRILLKEFEHHLHINPRKEGAEGPAAEGIIIVKRNEKPTVLWEGSAGIEDFAYSIKGDEISCTITTQANVVINFTVNNESGSFVYEVEHGGKLSGAIDGSGTLGLNL